VVAPPPYLDAAQSVEKSMKNFISGILILATSIAVYFNLGIKLKPHLVAGGINEAFWPKLLLIILMGLSVILIFSGLKKFDEIKAALKSFKGSTFFNIKLLKLVLAFVFCFLYVIVIKYIGFLFATPLLLGGLTYLLGYKKWTLIVTPVVATVAILLIFSKLIGTPLPLGTGIFREIGSFLS
jgi:hypothetical protein